MAGLKKPANCACGNIDLVRKYGPERWECNKCGAIVRTRLNKPDSNSCRVCSAVRGSKPFKPGKNLCVECYNVYMDNYYKINHDKQLAYKKEYYKENRVRIRERDNAWHQKDPENFIKSVMHSSKCAAERRYGSRARELKFELTFEFMIQMYNSQEGLCKLSKLPMTHKWSDLCSISIDRINSDGDYVHDNVQLVCKWVNLAKQRCSNDEFMIILNKYYESRLNERVKDG